MSPSVTDEQSEGCNAGGMVPGANRKKKQKNSK
jgi:hypothetical protein